jgi:hypothetical protein
MNDHGIYPRFSEAGFEISERVTPDGIVVSIIVSNYKRFIDSLLEIKGGGKKSFTKHDLNRSVIVNIINADASKIL